MTTPQPFREVRSVVQTEINRAGYESSSAPASDAARGWYQMSAGTGRLFGVAGPRAESLLVRDFGTHEQADPLVADGPSRTSRLVVPEQRDTSQPTLPL